MGSESQGECVGMKRRHCSGRLKFMYYRLEYLSYLSIQRKHEG